MKRKPLLFLLLMALFAPLAMMGQQTTLTVYDGTETNSTVPAYMGYFDDFTRSQYVIPATALESLGDGAVISSLKFYSNSNNVPYPATGKTPAPVVVYLKEVSYTSISAFEATASASTVYTGTLAVVTEGNGGSMTIDFDTPFIYHNGNLLVGIENTDDADYQFIYFYGQTVTGASVSGYNSNSLSGVSPTQRNFIPKTTFTYTPGTISSCPRPTNLVVSNVTNNSAVLTWKPGGDETEWMVEYKTADATSWTLVPGTVSDTTYTLTDLASGTGYEARVQASCNEGKYVSTSFTTKCNPNTTFPWNEDFEGYSAGNFVDPCWVNEHISGGGTQIFKIYASSNGTNTTKQLQLPDMTSGTMTKLVLPGMSIPTGVIHEFDIDVYRNTNSSSYSGEGIRVYASTNGEIEGATELAFISRNYTTVYAVNNDTIIPAESGSGWYTYKLPIPFTGTCYIILRGESKYGSSTYMDNFVIREKPSCVQPTALVASEETGTTAKLTWTANGDEAAWDIYYSTTATAPTSETTPSLTAVGTNPYTLAELTPSTNYYAWVRANCGGSVSDWSASCSFATECEVVSTYPYSENFDSFTAGNNVLPICWSYINTTTYSSYAVNPRVYANSSYTTYAHTAPNCLYFYSYYSSYSNYDPQPQYAILPEMSNLDSKQIILFAKGYNTSSTIKVGRMTDPSDATTFSLIQELTLTTSYKEFCVDLTGNGNYIALMIDAATSGRTANGVYIDDIVVRAIPDCATPTGLAVATNSLTPEGATITWIAGEGTEWTVEYKKDTEETWTTVTPNVTDSTYTFTGLDYNTIYNTRVSVACTGVTYPTNPVSFTTKVRFPAPTNLVTSNLTHNSVTLAWTAGYTNQTDWKVEYKKSSDDWTAAVTETVSNPTIDLSELVENTTYNVRVYGGIGTEFGTNALSGSFTTKYPCAAPTALVISNITNNSATLGWTPGYQETEWTVLYWPEEATDTLRRVVNGLPTVSLTDLRAFTTYNVRVINCENALAGSFITATNVPYAENFNASTAPKGWARYLGLLEYVLSDSIQLSTTTSGWTYTTDNGVFDKHARVNIYGSSCKYWLVTPTMLMENNVQLTFDLALTKYSGTLQPVVDSLQQDDKFVVLISTNGRSSWTVLRQWDNAGSEYVYNDIACSATGRQVAIDLSSYAGQYVAIAFYGESTNPSNMQNTGGDNNLHVDNVSIDYIPSCVKPTGLTVSNVKNHKATLSWTENGEAEAWQICLNGDEDNPIPALENPYTLTGLEADSSYTVKVRANCGGNNGVSDWSNSVSFHTQIACPAPTGLSCTGVTVNTATLSWVENGDAEAWEICLNNDTTNLIPVRENPCTLTDLTPETVYSAKVRSECRSAWSNTINFEPTEKNVIGSGTGTNIYLPLHNWYKYSLTQQIYTAAELGDAGYITSIDFYKNNTIQCVRDVDIYMVSTTKTSFASTSDWITVTAADRVFSGEVTFADNAWTSIDFDVPFNYDGQSNVAIIVDDNTGGYKSSTPFLAYDAPGQAIRAYYDTYDFDPFNPSGAANYNAGVENQKNQIRILKANCLKPNHITVEEFTNSVNIDWEGESDSYNVRYRTAETTILAEGSFFEDFESGELTGWTTVRNAEGNEYTDWKVVNSETLFEDVIPAHSGSYVAMSRSWYSFEYAAPNVDNWLITPQVALNGELSYWVMDDGEYHEHYDIYISTTTNDISSFTLLYEPGDASETWTKYTYDLSSYAGQLGYIAFRHTDNDQDFLFIDDVFVGSMTTVPAGEWVELPPVSETFIEIDNLTSNTQYEYQIQGVCGEDPSHWTTIADFTTLAEGTMVFVTEGDWNVANNWVPANLPTEDNNVVIRKDATIPAGVIAYANEATLDGGSITIKDGGQLVHNTDELWATVEKEITGYGNSDYGYNFIATPLMYSDSYYADYLVTFTEDVENLIPEDEESYDLYEFDPTQEGAEWRNDKTSSVYMYTGDGYLYANPVNDTLKFEGALWKTKDNYLRMSVADTLTTTSNGWRLLGNPFVTIGYLVGLDDEFNIIENNFYTMNAAGDGYDLSESAVGLYPCEGAFVQDAADADSQTIYFFSYNPFAGGDKSGILNMNLLQEGNKIDQARLRFGKGNELGKMTFRKDQSKLSITKDGEEFAVVYVGNKGEMPVSFSAEKGGTYTIDFSTDNVNFSYLHLIDTVTNTEVDLIANPSYTFEAKAGEYARRFTIVYETK